MQENFGLIQVYTGNGKGKTTAALGMGQRAASSGKKVVVVFFDKGGEHYSERKKLSSIGIDWLAFGLDRIDPKTGRFRFGVLPEDIKEAEQGLLKAKEFILSGNYDLVILDEINTTINLGMIAVQDVLGLLRQRPKHVEIVCTGRDAPQELIDFADLVTEMKMLKHYFYKGVPAREGIDY